MKFEKIKEEFKLRKRYLIAAFGLFLLINTITLFDGHNWGDDFAQYILHAVNFVEHKPYASNIALDLWVTVSPGFPLILSAVIYWFGINLKILKFLNVIFWGLSALLVYGITAKRLGKLWAGLVTIWFLSSPLFFYFKQNVLSDIPFMFFVLFFIWSFLKYEEGKKIFLFIAIFSLSYACLVRPAGLVLVLATVIYLGIIRKNWKGSLVFILAGVIAWCIQLVCGVSVLAHLGSGAHVSFDMGQYFLKMILGFFITAPNVYTYVSKPAFILGPVLLLGMAVVFFNKIRQNSIGLMGCFVSLYVVGILLWPAQGGIRYIFPIFIPLAVYLIELAKMNIAENILIGIFIILILQNIFVIGAHWKFNDDAVFQKDSIEMISWVKKNLKEDEHYMFYKPRALSLFTGRVGTPFWVHLQDAQQWYRRIKLLNIHYIIADKQLDQVSTYEGLSFPVENYVLRFSKVWENSKYKIMEVKY